MSYAELKRVLAERPELMKRMLLLAHEPPVEAKIECRHDLLPYFGALLWGRETEALAVLALDRRRKVIDCEILSEGSDRATVVDPRQVFRWALTRRKMPGEVVLAHNHPSGDPMPSAQDRDVTIHVSRAGSTLGITLLDHLILGWPERNFRSMAGGGILPEWE